MVWLICVHTSIQSRTFKSYEELIADYENGELHPADLKPALSKSLNKILEVMIFYYVNVNVLYFQFSSSKIPISVLYSRL